MRRANLIRQSTVGQHSAYRDQNSLSRSSCETCSAIHKLWNENAHGCDS